MLIPTLNQSSVLRKQIALDLSVMSVEDLSQESLVTMSKNMLQNFVKFVPEVLLNITEFKHSFLEDTSDIRLNSDNRKFVEVISRIPFVSIQDDTAYVPEGFLGKYLDYLQVLKGAPQLCKEAQSHVFPEFKRTVASIVSSPELARNINAPVISLLRERSKIREDFNNLLNKFFDKGANNTVTTVKQVVDKNNDWTPMLHLLETTSKDMLTVDRNRLLKLVDETSELLKHLVRKAQSGGFDDMSPENIMMLSEGAYQMATEVEFYAVMHYRIMTLNVAVNDTTAALVKNHKM